MSENNKTRKNCNKISESIEGEAYKYGSHSQIWKDKNKKEDDGTKVEITSTYAILWNASRKEVIQSLLDKGTNMEYIGSSAGTYVWGRGIYTNFQRYQAHYRTVHDKSLYGTVLVKYKYHGNIMKECLTAEPQLWEEPLSKQIKRFKGLDDYLKTNGVDVNRLDSMAKDDYSSSAMASIRNACGGFRSMANVLLGFGVQGIIFFGRNDRPVAVIYDADKLEVLDYADNTDVKDLDKDLSWSGLKDGEGGRTSGNDINPILQYFKQFHGNPAYTRPQCGEILLTDKNTGKYTFVDYAKAKDIISNLGHEDPRLFGDFEFYMAQNFQNENGKEVAFVQVDEDRKSQFYVDKKGNLYSKLGERPISNIKGYYPDNNKDARNEPDDKDMDFDIDDDDFDSFKNIFGESILRRINETLQGEGRIEKQDGHVEVDNFGLARKIMKFKGPDDSYFVEMAERHKDHPDRHYEHNACDYKGFFEITSVDHLNAVEPVIKRLCQTGEWRAMMYINPRPMGDTREYANNVLAPRFKKYNSYLQGHEIEVAYGQSKDWPERPLCFIDVDNDNENIQKQVLDYIRKMGLKPIDMYKTTNNGLHIILPDKDEARKLDFSFLDNGKDVGKWATAGLEIDKPMTLYAYVRPNGYGVQRRMQKKLGAR